MKQLSPKALEARRQYEREYRRKWRQKPENKEKQKEYERRYWESKAQQSKGECKFFCVNGFLTGGWLRGRLYMEGRA
ncbi:hypothetical protein [Brevibacillus agri]|uniref:hypothetical protein n=1 Tax=Brevibacillus agri TaxID=51101 RepID=UPI003D245C94